MTVLLFHNSQERSYPFCLFCRKIGLHVDQESRDQVELLLRVGGFTSRLARIGDSALAARIWSSFSSSHALQEAKIISSVAKKRPSFPKRGGSSSLALDRSFSGNRLRLWDALQHAIALFRLLVEGFQLTSTSHTPELLARHPDTQLLNTSSSKIGTTRMFGGVSPSTKTCTDRNASSHLIACVCYTWAYLNKSQSKNRYYLNLPRTLAPTQRLPREGAQQHLTEHQKLSL